MGVDGVDWSRVGRAPATISPPCILHLNIHGGCFFCARPHLGWPPTNRGRVQSSRQGQIFGAFWTRLRSREIVIGVAGGRRTRDQSTPSTINNMTATLAIFVFIFIKRKET